VKFVILYPFSVRYVCKLDSWAHILWAFGLPLKPGVTTLYADLVFLHLVALVGHVVRSSVSGAWNIDAIFFMLRWAWCNFHKKHTIKCYAEHVFFISGEICETRSAFHVFLHPVGSASHVVSYGAPAHKTLTNYLSCLGGPDAVIEKSVPRHVMTNFCFWILRDLRVT
jgi:hypothetical protein